MRDKIHKFMKWVLSIVSEVDGSGSSSRIACVLIVATVCFCCLWHTIVNKAMPDGGSLGGFGGLIGAGGGLYGLNKWASVRKTEAGVTTNDANTPTA